MTISFPRPAQVAGDDEVIKVGGASGFLKMGVECGVGGGAMAAPMLLASVPLSTTLPVVTWVIKGPVPLRDRMTAPDPVVVHCAVGGFCPPYSRGLRYWRSAEQNGRRSEPLRRKQSRPSTSMAAETSLPPWWSRRRIGRKRGVLCPEGVGGGNALIQQVSGKDIVQLIG